MYCVRLSTRPARARLGHLPLRLLQLQPHFGQHVIHVVFTPQNGLHLQTQPIRPHPASQTATASAHSAAKAFNASPSKSAAPWWTFLKTNVFFIFFPSQGAISWEESKGFVTASWPEHSLRTRPNAFAPCGFSDRRRRIASKWRGLWMVTDGKGLCYHLRQSRPIKAPQWYHNGTTIAPHAPHHSEVLSARCFASSCEAVFRSFQWVFRVDLWYKVPTKSMFNWAPNSKQESSSKTAIRRAACAMLLF